MNYSCLLISPCELIFVKWIVNLHNMFVWINHVSIYLVLYISMCCIICVEWHNAFHMHRGNLEVRCVCMTQIF